MVFFEKLLLEQELGLYRQGVQQDTQGILAEMLMLQAV